MNNRIFIWLILFVSGFGLQPKGGGSAISHTQFVNASTALNGYVHYRLQYPTWPVFRSELPKINKAIRIKARDNSIGLPGGIATINYKNFLQPVSPLCCAISAIVPSNAAAVTTLRGPPTAEA